MSLAKLIILTAIIFFPLSGFPQPDSMQFSKTRSDTLKTDNLKQDDVLTDSSKNKILSKIDSTKQRRIREVADSIGKAYSFQFREKQVYSLQLNLINNLLAEIRKINDYFESGIDTAGINNEIRNIDAQFSTASDGVLTNESGESLTFRNLSASYLLMKELLDRLERRKRQVEDHLGNLGKLRHALDSLQNDTLLFVFAKDSAIFKDYLKKILDVSGQMSAADKKLTAAIKDLQNIDNVSGLLESNIKNGIQAVEEKRKNLADDIFDRESSEIPSASQDTLTGSKIWDYSYVKGRLVINYYLKNNFERVLISFFVFLFLSILLRDVKKRAKKISSIEPSGAAGIILKHPYLTSAYLTLTICQFLFLNPPVVFQGGIWILSLLIIMIMTWTGYSVKQRIFFMLFILLFLLALISDLYLIESEPERILMFIVALAGIAWVILVFRTKVIYEETRRTKSVLLLLTGLFLSGSVLGNILGRYNLSKSLLTVGIFMLMTAFLLYRAMILLREIASVSYSVYESDGNENFRKKISSLKSKTPGYLKIFFVAGWLILFSHNFYFYESLINGLREFLEKERAVGESSFTFMKVLIFIVIIICSTILSKIISFFADKSDNTAKQGSDSRSALSNWMLLIRIAVISLGILLAFAATGMPMDNLAIIIGSLGVGIGFGLQTIFNNLVSGILLAFEKPFRIGDQIEITNQFGRIKEIGIRSSKISTPEGSDVIIPNGDLLSKHVTNWTFRNSLKRSELLLTLGIGSRLSEIKKLLEDILERNETITKIPPPQVLIQNFSGSSVNYRLLFWSDINAADSVKSEVIIEIENKLTQAGIELK